MTNITRKTSSHPSPADFNAARDAREGRGAGSLLDAGLGDSIPGGSTLGKPAPALDMVKWVGSKPNLTDKFAIISVWSPKSASSRKWIPAMNELYKNLSGKNRSARPSPPRPNQKF